MVTIRINWMVFTACLVVAGCDEQGSMTKVDATVMLDASSRPDAGKRDMRVMEARDMRMTDMQPADMSDPIPGDMAPPRTGRRLLRATVRIETAPRLRGDLKVKFKASGGGFTVEGRLR